MAMPPTISYADALHRLLSLADYERMAGLSAPAPKIDLGRMRELAERLGRPQDAAPVLHVAGTKGKGSVAATQSAARLSFQVMRKTASTANGVASPLAIREREARVRLTRDSRR